MCACARVAHFSSLLTFPSPPRTICPVSGEKDSFSHYSPQDTLSCWFPGGAPGPLSTACSTLVVSPQLGQALSIAVFFFYHVHVKRKQYFLGSYYWHGCKIGAGHGVARLQLAAASHPHSMEKFISPMLLISVFVPPLLSPEQGLFTFIRPTWLFSSTGSAAPWRPSSYPFIVATEAQVGATCK